MTMEMSQPVPELPVSDVEKAQDYYQKYFGCKIEWIYPGKEMAAVSNGETAIFFRKRTNTFQPAVLWVYCHDVDATYKELLAVGADIVEEIEEKPWNLRQFTVYDFDGNVLYFHG